ncbi:MAG: hypothetical protein J3K34DRAFT_403441 [Monoraphidium minutum]|nr:MAG: hypothetical protein J3K34DRAFT_403441 [Monoraphidium minutum]
MLQCHLHQLGLKGGDRPIRGQALTGARPMPVHRQLRRPQPHPQRAPGARPLVAARAADQGPGSGGGDSGQPRSNLPAPLSTGTFLSLESLIQNALALQRLPGERGDWQEVEGSWVLYPPEGRRPEAMVHFLGGAFVGAAPQLAYRTLLESLASRGVLIVATPFSTGFDHLRSADEIQYKYDRCIAALKVDPSTLPVYGVGHSLGSVMHALICSRYAPMRAGNALMAFNNRPATDTIPFLSPLIAPSARALSPLLAQLASPGPLRSTVEGAADALRGLSPSLLRQVTPLIDQLAPIFLDVSQGRQEFTPPPLETKAMIRNYYAVRRNLLLRFQDDTIDETLPLAMLLQESSAVSASLDLSVRTLPGDHIRPLQQSLGSLPPELARAANQAAEQGSNILGRLAGLAQQAGVQAASVQLEGLQKGVSSLADMIGTGQGGGGLGADSVQALADEIAAFMGVGGVVTQGSKALPASLVVERGGASG